MKNLGSNNAEKEPSGHVSDIAQTLLARDYKGLSNHPSNGCLEVFKIWQ